MRKINFLLAITLLLVILLSACGGDGAASDPAPTVEKYLQAKAEGDVDTIRELLCAEMESVWERESRTFESVSDVRLEGMTCSQVDDSNIVACEGKYVATYGAEDTEFPLSSYRVVAEDGEWKWCGEG